MELLWQKYETQVHGIKNSRQNNWQGKQFMWGPEEGTAEKQSEEFRSPIAYNNK